MTHSLLRAIEAESFGYTLSGTFYQALPTCTNDRCVGRMIVRCMTTVERKITWTANQPPKVVRAPLLLSRTLAIMRRTTQIGRRWLPPQPLHRAAQQVAELVRVVTTTLD
jgi:hypothetical protein